MLPSSSPAEVPAFYRLGTLADMSRMAAKLALARKAIAEIRKIEDYLEAHSGEVSNDDFKLAMKETSDYAETVASATGEAVEFLKTVKANVESYQESIHDATD